MDTAKKLRYREFRIWFINSLQNWADYCEIDKLLPINNKLIHIVYHHSWKILKDWSEQDLHEYMELQKRNMV
jgi:hypothetical protein